MRTPGDMDNTFERIRVGDMDLYSVPTTPVFDAIRSDNLHFQFINTSPDPSRSLKDYLFEENKCTFLKETLTFINFKMIYFLS